MKILFSVYNEDHDTEERVLKLYLPDKKLLQQKLKEWIKEEDD